MLVGLLVFATFLYGFAQAVVAPLIPALSRELGVGSAHVSWLLTGFVLMASVATPIAGRLGDMYGYGRMLRIVLLLAAAGAVLAAASDVFPLILLGRIVQGVSAAVFPLAYGVLRASSGPRDVSGLIGLVSAGVGIGGAAGAALGGVVADHLGARAVFALVGALSVLVALAAVILRIPDRPRGPGTQSVDVLGAGLLVVWVSMLLLVITQASQTGWSSSLGVMLLVGAIALALWIRVERRAKTPIVTLSLLANRRVLLANLLAFSFAFLQFTLMIAVPAFLQAPSAEGFGFSASIALSGLVVVPQTLVFMTANLLTGLTARLFGNARMLVAAALCVTASAGILVFAHDRIWQFVVATSLLGLGLGLMYSHLPATLVRAVPESELGSVTGMNQNFRNIGSSMGAQVCAAVLAVVPGLPGFLTMFIAMLAVGLGTAAIASGLVRAERRG